MEFSCSFLNVLHTLLFLVLVPCLLTLYLNPRGVNLPPSPIALPIIGHLYLLGPLFHESLQKLSNKYGSLMHLRLGSLGPAVIVSSPSLSKEVMKTQELNFVSRPPLLGSEFLGEGLLPFTFAPYGPYMKFIKKLCVTELLSIKKLNYFSKIRREENHFFLASLLEKSKLGEPVDMEVALTALTNNIICRMVMSTRCLANVNEAEECRMIVDDLISIVGKLNLVHILSIFDSYDFSGYGKKLAGVHGRFMVLVEKILKAHEEKRRNHQIAGDSENKEEEDFMDVLLKVSEDDCAEIKLSRDGIKLLLEEIFTAGTGTSSSTLQWGLAQLINNPRVFNKSRQEIESVVGTCRGIKVNEDN